MLRIIFAVRSMTIISPVVQPDGLPNIGFPVSTIISLVFEPVTSYVYIPPSPPVAWVFSPLAMALFFDNSCG